MRRVAAIIVSRKTTSCIAGSRRIEVDEYLVEEVDEQGRGSCYRFPGGKEERGESACEAMRREAWEELGITDTGPAIRFGRVVRVCLTDARFAVRHFRCRAWKPALRGGGVRARVGSCLVWRSAEEILRRASQSTEEVARLLVCTESSRTA